MTKARLVVLISGNGSNLQAIQDACAGGQLEAEVAAVFSNQPAAYGLERAKQAGVPAIALPKPKEQDRLAYDGSLADAVARYQPDWVVLAGWMRILSDRFLKRFPWKVLNLHPALPGAFPGTHAIERALAAYQAGQITETGVMVHLVPDEGVDNGPVLAVERVPIYPGEALEALQSRIHTTEHALLVKTISRILSDHEWLERMRYAYRPAVSL